jgi:ParB-like chromosome segregation protein Spo0J
VNGSGLAAASLPLSAIVVDDANQPRTDELDEEYIEQLAAIPELWPPVAVVKADNGSYLLTDGFHRLEAARRLDLREIPVTVLPMPADGDLQSLGFDFNAKHGRPLTLVDRKEQAARLLRRDPSQSDRSISQRCGIAASTVATIRSRLEQGAEIEQSEERVGADGRTYTRPDRRPGELPDKPLGQLVGDGIKGLFDPRERREQRETARYLQRLKIALADALDLPGWKSPEAIAQACVEALGEDQAQALARDLSPLVLDLVDVVELLEPTT